MDRRRMQLRSFVHRSLALLLLAGCEASVLPLPQADDPIFLRMADVQLGMRQSELLRRHPSLETSPEDELREAYGAGWITYGFRGLMDLRLSSLRVWMTFADSAFLRERHEDLVASLRSAYGYDAECYRRTSTHLDEIRLVWKGKPSTGVSSQIFASADRRGYTAELVVLVGDSVPRLDGEGRPCDESPADESASVSATRDSAGISIVELYNLDRPPADWRLASEPEVVIGSLDGPLEHRCRGRWSGSICPRLMVATPACWRPTSPTSSTCWS
jgi:hypothetical protein